MYEESPQHHRDANVFKSRVPVKIHYVFKGTLHPKMKVQSSFTHPQVDPNLYECVCSEDILENEGNTVFYLFLWKSMEPKTA